MFSPASGIEARTKIPPMFRRWKMFEHSLIDLDAELEAKTNPRRRRWISLPLAIGLHLVGLTAFAFASYWNVGPVTEPDLNVAFIDVVLPKPMIQQGGGVSRPPAPTHRPQPVPPVPETQTVQPDLGDIPDTPAPPAPGPTQESIFPGTDPTAPPGPGDPNGDPNSHNEVGDIHGTLEPVPPAVDGPVYLTPEMSRPRALQPIQPRYTEQARKAGVQGTVIVEAIIDETGHATNVRVVRGLPMGLDRSAVEAIRQVTFQPAMRGGRPVKVYFNLTVNFTIQR
jgi:protein TonB